MSGLAAARVGRQAGLFRLAFVGCTLLLAYGLFRPEPPPDLFHESDKLLHLLAFGALTFTARLAFPRLPVLWAFWLLLPLAPTLEWLQHWWQPRRTFSWQDASANGLGVLLGCAAAQLWLRWTGPKMAPASFHQDRSE